MTGLRAGAARTDTTVYEPGLPMLGWGLPTNTAEGVHTPLHARAFVFANRTGARVAFVACELSMISDSLRLGVLEQLELHAPELGIGSAQLMMTATHTHSGPGGYPHHMFYNLPNPGVVPRVLRGLVSRIAQCIIDAAAALQPAVVRWGNAHVPLDAPIAFNRSLESYNRNEDVTPVTWARRHEATDREMQVLRVDTPDGDPIGLIDWFAVHCTSVHSDQHLLHPDNKGIAALLTEAQMGPGTVAVFAQGAAGDVSPNHRYDHKRKLMVGGGVDDYESAALVGKGQFESAGRAHTKAGDSEPLSDTIDSVMLHLDMRGFEVSPRFARGRTGCRTGASRMGLTFIEGTVEGPGPLGGAPQVTRALVGVAKARQYYKNWRYGRAVRRAESGEEFAENVAERQRFEDVHGAKFPFLNVGDGALTSAFGGFRADRPALPGFIDPVVRAMHAFSRIEGVNAREWAPNVLSVQVLIIGEVAIVGIPLEPTTVAGRRMRAQVQAALAPRGVNHVVICGYANGYASYLTTWEEYQTQRYEAASTLFGQWTLGAIQTRLEEACGRLRVPANQRDLHPGPPIEPMRAAEVFAQVWEGVAGGRS